MSTFWTMQKLFLSLQKFILSFKFYRHWDLLPAMELFISISKKATSLSSKKWSANSSISTNLIIIKCMTSTINRNILLSTLLLKLLLLLKEGLLPKNLMFFHWASWYTISFLENILIFFRIKNLFRNLILNKVWGKKLLLFRN